MMMTYKKLYLSNQQSKLDFPKFEDVLCLQFKKINVKNTGEFKVKEDRISCILRSKYICEL